MYVAQPLRIPEPELSRLVRLAAQLDLRPGPGGSFATAPRETAATFHPALSDVLSGDWTHAMVVGLYPSAQLVGHCDPPCRGTRTHIPLQVNEGCWVFHGGQWQQLIPGCGYQMDPTIVHGAVNWGATLRLHLVIDLE